MVVTKHQRDIAKHDEIAHWNCEHISLALTIQLVLNRPLHQHSGTSMVLTKSQLMPLKVYKNKGKNVAIWCMQTGLESIPSTPSSYKNEIKMSYFLFHGIGLSSLKLSCRRICPMILSSFGSMTKKYSSLQTCQNTLLTKCMQLMQTREERPRSKVNLLMNST